MTLAEPMTPCRRRALLTAGLSLAVLVAAWGMHAAGLPISDWVLGLLTGLGVGGLFAAVLLWFSPDLSDAVPKRLGDRYRREMLPPMAGYVISVVAWKRLLHVVDATWLRVILSLLPALFVLGVLRAFVRYVRDSDEMQRRIELESGAIAGLLVSAGYLSAGFLQSAGLIAVASKVAMLWVFPLVGFAYGITKVVISRRYA